MMTLHSSWGQGDPAMIPVLRELTSNFFDLWTFSISMNMVGVPRADVHLEQETRRILSGILLLLIFSLFSYFSVSMASITAVPSKWGAGSTTLAPK